MQLEPKSNADRAQKQCSWSTKAMQLGCKNIAGEKLQKCCKKEEFMQQKTQVFRLIKRL
jgi:hypothetical protein